jgi:hydrogenase maturation protein HypF
LLAEITVSGVVQGVGFRPFIYRIAVKNGLLGSVQNRGDAGVKIEVQGSENSIKKFLNDLEKEKPPLAKLYSINVDRLKKNKKYSQFTILKSSRTSEKPGSVIPPDVFVCNDCISELRNHSDRRFDYFFITCTNCGPRFTIIEDIPYDKPYTTMKTFPMCDRCKSEYTDPLDRRFHAQTIACSDCGPKVYLTTNDGSVMKVKDPIREAGKLIDEGLILAIKGNGGFHIATSSLRSESIKRLRNVKHRKQKPFAIMARDLLTIRSFAKISPAEESLLLSYIRPIVLLDKNDDYFLSDEVAPGLYNVGVMLPYTGLHLLLFDGSKEPAFIMTSANPPNEPIVIKNKEGLRKLGNDVDYFLFHNREISQRADDSVVKFIGNTPSIIRRSRGYVPEPVQLDCLTKKCVLALGGELNLTFSIFLENKVYISQHIGDVEELETLEFLKDAIRHLLNLTKAKYEVIACDLHPSFHTTKLADELSKNELEVFQVQHHYAHIGSLMGEHNVDEIVGISCDGYGYGQDGSAWGGEIFSCMQKDYRRVAHLEPQPMIGGDLATKYPARMVVSMIGDRKKAERWLLSHIDMLPHGKKEAEIILNQLEKGKFLTTTSTGRVLDAVATILEVCHERTYEGEPAIKLETLAKNGNDVLGLNVSRDKSVLNTSYLMEEILNNFKKYPKQDLAYSAHIYIAKGLAEIAIEKALEQNISTIGFSGGVAYNSIITKGIKKIVEKSGLKFITNIRVPPGDGGISFGQAIIASKLLD